MKYSLIGRIKQMRRLRGLTQAQVASYLHISVKAYNRMENGHTRIDVERLHKIAAILKWDAFAFMQNEGMGRGAPGCGKDNWVSLRERWRCEKEQYEQRIAELREEVRFWRSRLDASAG